MRHHVIASFFLALEIVLSVCGEPTVIVSDAGSYLNLITREPQGKLKNCSLVTNTGKLYSIYPTDESPGLFDPYYNNHRCAVEVKETDSSTAGLWTLNTITDKENFTTEFKVRIKRTITVKPAKIVKSRPGLWITVELDTNETDVRVCNLTGERRPTVDLKIANIEGVKLHGPCGVRILVNESSGGYWTLSEQVGEWYINKAHFQISIVGDSDTNIQASHETWAIGKPNEIYVKDREIIFCQITAPDGRKMPVTFKTCIYEVPVVSAHHEGTWRASYAKTGDIDIVHHDIIVKTIDRESVECSYFHEKSGTGEINILCKSYYVKLDYCSFIRPDGRIMNLPVGVSNGNYSYYGIGYNDESPNRVHAECGVTIHEPSTVDFGIWTCEMLQSDREKPFQKIRGSVINVVNTRAGLYHGGRVIDHRPVFVRRGDQCKIACKADASLKYCWLKSPNGTAYGVTTDGSSGQSLKYDGNGLESGECGALINPSESGEWTCHLGIDGGFEIEEKVSVIVTDTYLVANSNRVYRTENATLTCRTFIGDNDTINYCRWVRPSGLGIDNANAHRYRMSKNLDTCSLTISDILPDDVGQWTCVAGLSVMSEEQWATIEVLPPKIYRNVTSFSLGSGLLIVILFATSWVAFFVYRRKTDRVVTNLTPYPNDHIITEKPQIPDGPIINQNYKY